MEVALKPKPPKKINGNVKALIRKLGLENSKPQFLVYTHRSDKYRATYCFNNCEDENKKTGCEVIYGWMIWEDRKKSFIEAEFHSVIKENGQILDISPRQINCTKILFVADKLRNSGRKGLNTWYSYTNLKMHKGNILEESKECEIVEINEDYSELRIL